MKDGKDNVKDIGESKKQRKLEELNLIDDFLFTVVACYGEDGRRICQSILEIILGRSLHNLKVEIQKVIPAVDMDKHGIRMDIVIHESEPDNSGGVVESVYDIEMEKKDFIPKRARFYHALEDRKLLNAGDDYNLLGNVFVIIIMPKDPFGKDRMMYTIKRQVVEDSSIEYEDGDITLYLYTKGKVTDGRQELEALLRYVENSVQENAVGPKLAEIHGIIQKVKCDKEVGVAYMKSFERDEMIREEARQEGREEERRNTERERMNAEKARELAQLEKARADEAEKELEKLREELKKYR